MATSPLLTGVAQEFGTGYWTFLCESAGAGTMLLEMSINGSGYVAIPSASATNADAIFNTFVPIECLIRATLTGDISQVDFERCYVPTRS